MIVLNKQNDRANIKNDYRANIITGCSFEKDVCPVCDICQSKKWAIANNRSFKPTFHQDRLILFNKELTKIPVGSKIWVGSFGDMWGPFIPDEWIEEVIRAIKNHPNHIYLFLTKNPVRYKYFDIPFNCWLGLTDTYNCGKNYLPYINSLREVLKNYKMFAYLKPFTGWNEEIIKYMDWTIWGGVSDHYISEYPFTPAIEIKLNELKGFCKKKRIPLMKDQGIIEGGCYKEQIMKKAIKHNCLNCYYYRCQEIGDTDFGCPPLEDDPRCGKEYDFDENGYDIDPNFNREIERDCWEIRQEDDPAFDEYLQQQIEEIKK